MRQQAKVGAIQQAPFRDCQMTDLVRVKAILIKTPITSSPLESQPVLRDSRLRVQAGLALGIGAKRTSTVIRSSLHLHWSIPITMDL